MPSPLELLILKQAMSQRQTPRSAVSFQLAQNAASGQGPVRDWGDAVSNISKSLVGAYGTYQGMQQQEDERAKAEADIQAAMQQAQQPEPPRIGDISPRDFTPQSLAAYQQSGRYSDLIPYEKPGELKAPPFRTITRGDQEVQQEYGPDGWRDVGSGPRWNPNSQAPSTTVNNYMPGEQVAKVPESVRTDFSKTRATLQAARDDFKVLRNYNPSLVDRFAGSAGFKGPEGARATSAYNALMFKIAKLEEQGALQAPDKETVMGMMGSIFDPRIGPEARAATMDQMESWFDAKERALNSTIGSVAPAEAPVATPDITKPPTMNDSIDKYSKDAAAGKSVGPTKMIWRDGKLVPER